MKKILSIFIVIFISGCGFEQSFKTDNITINIQELRGDNEINKRIEKSLSIFGVKGVAKKQINFILESNKEKIIISKDTFGEPNQYQLIIKLNIKIVDNDQILNQKNFIAKGLMNNQLIKSNLNTYEKQLVDNLIEKLNKEIIFYFYSL